MSKKDFLDNLRVARNLLVHGEVSTEGRQLDSAALSAALARAALWLTPSAVKGFQADDFRELGAPQQKALAVAVQEFLNVAANVPPDRMATDDEFNAGTDALEKILAVVESYLPEQHEMEEIRTTLGHVNFPPWILNWDYEVGSDEEGVPVLWVTLYADESAIPADQFGRRALEVIPAVRSALAEAGIRRWPYVRVRTAREHKAGQGAFGNGATR
jgi:hypothetical protein